MPECLESAMLPEGAAQPSLSSQLLFLQPDVNTAPIIALMEEFWERQSLNYFRSLPPFLKFPWEPAPSGVIWDINAIDFH